MRIIISTILLMFTTGEVQASDLDPPSLAKHLGTVEAPVPIKRINPKYPKSAARQGRTGWATFSFVIEKNGSVSNIVKLDSSGSKDFERESLRAIKHWQYKPAMENGEPIQRCVNTVQLNFKISSKAAEDGVRRRFMKKYRLALEALEEKEITAVEQYIDEMSSFKNRYASESNLLNLLKAKYNEAIDNKQLQLTYLSKVQFNYGQDKGVKYKLAITHNKLVLAVQLNQLNKALNYVDRLTAMPLNEQQKITYQQLKQNIHKTIKSDKSIVVKGTLHQVPFWHFTPVRNSFSILNVSGLLTKMDVRCANKYHTYTVNEQSTWQIPENWQGCNVILYGQSGTTFDFVQLPEAADAV
ncbi:energy transducer TonB [Thalassotalea sediminis]|uniref:energy transducer TonB n=1 Tax=Thalassotalea sediminis TaxID=1759089 RepID=UPI00257289A9|nr:energy transducer TonB [Thalassotalea sediminis]